MVQTGSVTSPRRVGTMPSVATAPCTTVLLCGEPVCEGLPTTAANIFGTSLVPRFPPGSPRRDHNWAATKQAPLPIQLSAGLAPAEAATRLAVGARLAPWDHIGCSAAIRRQVVASAGASPAESHCSPRFAGSCSVAVPPGQARRKRRGQLQRTDICPVPCRCHLLRRRHLRPG